MSFDQFKEFLGAVSESSGVELNYLVAKLLAHTNPGTHNTTVSDIAHCTVQLRIIRTNWAIVVHEPPALP